MTLIPDTSINICMEFRPVYQWMPDNAPDSTLATIVVSRCGIVKRLEYRRWCSVNNSYSTIKERVLKQGDNRGKQRKLNSNNKYKHVYCGEKTMSVHRLVALAWIPNPLNKPHVNHINGNKSDNRAENLEWVTNLENRQHADKTGLPRKSIEKISNEDVLQMKAMRLAGVKLSDIGEIYEVTGECVRSRTLKILSPKEIKTLRGKNNRWKNYNG